jgi:DNA repair photolyase
MQLETAALTPAVAADPVPVGTRFVPATIERNHFVHKSLSCFAFNPMVGCPFGCRFCYVPHASAIKLGRWLAEPGVDDPDAEWGEYAFVRPFDEVKFIASLRKAESTPAGELNADGNRAVMFSTTTDPWAIIRHPEPERRQELQEALHGSVRRALELILEHSTLNVRILTRSPLAAGGFRTHEAVRAAAVVRHEPADAQRSAGARV